MSARKHTVLVIDDDLQIRRLVEMKLKRAGYDVLLAPDGRAGFELMHTSPDAVITDLTMPCMDGREFCELTNPMKTRRPFLTMVLTGRSTVMEREWAHSLRDTVFVEKPFSPTELVKVLDDYFSLVQNASPVKHSEHSCPAESPHNG